MIRYYDLGAQNRQIEDELLDAAREVLRSGQMILGQTVADFESDFAALHGLPWAVSLNSGTDALILALRVLGVGEGDEVVTVPNSFVATVAAIRHLGATPVLVDVDASFNMDPEKLERALGPKTRVCIPVHLYGRPAPMDDILAVAERAGVTVVEDCAQAIGARFGGRPVGTFGVLGCYSLHPLKNLAALGDGGLVVGSDPDLDQALRRWRNHGLINRDVCEHWGFNSRLDALQAAMLRVKLGQLEGWTRRRRRLARRYLDELADLPLELPLERPGEESVWSTFTVRTRRREALREHLSRAGVETLIYYPIPIHLQPAARDLGYGPGSFPVCEEHAETIVSLPIRPELTDDEVGAIIAAVRDFFGG